MSSKPSSARPKTPAPLTHVKCRNSGYPKDEKIVRFPVPDDKVSWSVAFPDYKPVAYTSEKILKHKPDWADIAVPDKNMLDHFNAIDGVLDRRSFLGTYKIVNGLPQNPVGRTGICERAHLGRWGPNHAADPIVTRWKRDDAGKIVIHDVSKKPILQFVSILRGDVKEWAIPGGMVDAGENVTSTLKREFSEEAMQGLAISADERKKLDAKVDAAFHKGVEVYCGYVDDPRNTDNAWMETVAMNFHDEAGDCLAKFGLHAGDDAIGVKWTDMDASLKLYASHAEFVAKVAILHKAHW